MTRVYRILRKPFALSPFDGEGAYRYGGRWSSPGTRLVYTSEHQSLAMLEYFVRVDADDPPPELVLAIAEVPTALRRIQIGRDQLPKNWRDNPGPPEPTRFGDEFVQKATAAILVIPSVLSPNENNWLLNPAHPELQKIKIRAVEPLIYDTRLVERRHPRSKK